MSKGWENLPQRKAPGLKLFHLIQEMGHGVCVHVYEIWLQFIGTYMGKKALITGCWTFGC